MPQYYNPGLFPATYSPIGYYSGVQMPQNAANYMYQVDGETAARAWQAPGGQLPPNTIVPLFDVDGEHVYFKSTDMYGRMNPIRKGRVVFDEISQPISQGQSGQQQPQPQLQATPEPDMSKYVTKDDINELRKEIRSMINQNGSQSLRKPSYINQEGRSENRGETR